MMNTEQHTPAASAAPEEPFQARVQPWMMACFGLAIAADGAERNHRFLEESLELVQACGCSASEAHQLVDYVFGRPVGERAQEVGGVMVTLAALCLAQGLDMHAAGETELARIWTKVEAIRAKQAAKPKHSPLPAAAPQPIIGRLMDQISALPVLWGLNEPGALLRNSDVFRVPAAVGREQAAPSAQPAAVPDGWKLVPAEPNDAMQAAGAQAVRIDTTALNKIWTGNAVFRAMLAAAPAGPAMQDEAKPQAVLYAALDLNSRVVYSHENLENVEMNSGYIKTPTQVVGLAAIAVHKADGSAP